MKKILISFLLFAIISILFLNCVCTEKIPENKYEILAGTWMNEEYDSIHYNVKYEMYNDGSFLGFAKLYHIKDDIYRGGVYEIVETWKDAEGNIYLKTMSWDGDKIEGKPDTYDLSRISKDGSIWEGVIDRNDFPEEVDKENYNYFIYFRQ